MWVNITIVFIGRMRITTGRKYAFIRKYVLKEHVHLQILMELGELGTSEARPLTIRLPEVPLSYIWLLFSTTFYHHLKTEFLQ